MNPMDYYGLLCAGAIFVFLLGRAIRLVMRG